MNELTTSQTQLASAANPFLATTFDQVKELAGHISEAGVFGLKKPAQVITAMMLAREQGKTLSQLMREIHFHEDGKISQRADYTQAQFEVLGTIVWHIRNDEAAAATFFLKKDLTDEDRERGAKRTELLRELEDLRWVDPRDVSKERKVEKELAKLARENEETVLRTLADADSRGISQGGKGTKTNWATSPRSMLQWRCVTEGVKVVAPGVLSGLSSDVELQDAKAIEQREMARIATTSTVKEEDVPSIIGMIETYDAELATDLPDSRRKTLQGLRMDLVCKLADLGVKPPAQPEPPAPTVGGHPATRVETTVLPPETTTAPKTTRTRKPAAPAEAEVQQPEPVADKPWREVLCTRGNLPGSMNGKTLGYIFTEGRTAPKSVAAIKPLVDWFVTQAIHTSSDPVDRALWKAVQEAEAELRTTLTDTAPASAPATTTTPEAPKPAQAAPSTQRWQDFVIPGKHPEYSGKKMGDFGTAKQLAAFKTGYIDKIDWNNATLEQKRLKAMAAMALEEVAKDGTLPAGNSEPEAEPEHTQELRRMIEGSSLNRNDFMAVCRSNAWIDADADGIEDITEDEVMALQREWAVVSKTVKAAQP